MGGFIGLLHVAFTIADEYSGGLLKTLVYTLLLIAGLAGFVWCLSLFFPHQGSL